MNQSLYQSYFKDKKITKMGLGPLGRSFGDILFLAQNDAQLLVTDFRRGADIDNSISAIKKQLSTKQFKNITWVLGKHRLGDFKRADMVLRASAVPLNSPYVRCAKQNRVPTHASASLLTQIIREQLPGCIIIGVTGTKGKSTVTGMIESVLRESGRKYHLAGNVRGVTNLPLLKKIKDGDIVLMELDSWQLQGFNDVRISPDVSVFTNFFADHMNYYAGKMKPYFNDKAGIFRYQKNPRCVVSKQCKDAIREYGRDSDLDRIISVTKKDAPVGRFPVFGDHMIENMALVARACAMVSLSDTQIKKGLKKFVAIPGRMEYLGQFDDVHFYNDNNSTTPESTVLTLESVSKKHKKKITWWGGGADKQSDYAVLNTAVKKYVCDSVLFKGTATDLLLQQKNLQDVDVFDSTKNALAYIAQHAKKNSVVVFSPAATSFGMFANEYERNDQVVRAIKKFKRV